MSLNGTVLSFMNLVFVLVGTLANGLSAGAADAPPKSDAEFFQGRWRCVEARGKKETIEVGSHIVFWNDRCFAHSLERYVLRPEKSPKEIDFVIARVVPEKILGVGQAA